MHPALSRLNQLIEITRDGQRLYQRAADEVEDVELQHIFRDMAQAKTHVIQALSVKLAAEDEQPSQGGTFTGKLHQLFADTTSHLGGDRRVAYVDRLEDAEDRILHAFEDALDQVPPDVRALLATELPRLRACHERMQRLKHSLH